MIGSLGILNPTQDCFSDEQIARNRKIEKDMSIQPLPLEVVAQIKSSTTITSLNGVIFELVKNALDAESSKIEISVDYSRGSCTVEDNGLGIPPSEFRENGGLGKLYREHIYSHPDDRIH